MGWLDLIKNPMGPRCTSLIQTYLIDGNYCRYHRQSIPDGRRCSGAVGSKVFLSQTDTTAASAIVEAYKADDYREKSRSDRGAKEIRICIVSILKEARRKSDSWLRA